VLFRSSDVRSPLEMNDRICEMEINAKKNKRTKRRFDCQSREIIVSDNQTRRRINLLSNESPAKVHLALEQPQSITVECQSYKAFHSSVSLSTRDDFITSSAT
jgi:hypothetical protein